MGIMYAALGVLKMVVLCDLKVRFLTLLNESCGVLQFMFAERVLSRLVLGSLCCWIFSSYAYFLAWGDAIIDDPALPTGPAVLHGADLSPQMQAHLSEQEMAHQPSINLLLLPSCRCLLKLHSTEATLGNQSLPTISIDL